MSARCRRTVRIHCDSKIRSANVKGRFDLGWSLLPLHAAIVAFLTCQLGYRLIMRFSGVDTGWDNGVPHRPTGRNRRRTIVFKRSGWTTCDVGRGSQWTRH
ncbi:MAG: hypothetical protein MI923_12615 [Phycisphaerales bacterium]|nr:hypothetical protein [Phycisphaerales bacterium]